MTDGEYVPSTDEGSDPSSMDAVAASGDDEVVLTASPPTSSSSPHRRRKRRRRTVSSTVPCVLVDMDISEVEVPGHKQFKTFRGVWEDVVSWEELRARKPCYRVTNSLRPSVGSGKMWFPGRSSVLGSHVIGLLLP